MTLCKVQKFSVKACSISATPFYQQEFGMPIGSPQLCTNIFTGCIDVIFAKGMVRRFSNNDGS